MRNLLWLACVALAAKGAHSRVDAALGGGGSRGTRPLLEKVLPRIQDEVSQHKTESADVEHAELADAHKGGDAIDAAARWDRATTAWIARHARVTPGQSQASGRHATSAASASTVTTGRAWPAARTKSARRPTSRSTTSSA